MGNKTIHLNKEIENILENIIKKDPEFNLSKFLQDSILNHNNQSNIFTSKESLLNEIKKCDNKIKEFYLEKQKLILKTIELEETFQKQKIEQQQREEREKNNEVYKRKFIKDLFLEEIGRIMSDMELEQYLNLFNNKEVDSIYQYIDEYIKKV